MMSYFPEAIKGDTVYATSKRHHADFIDAFGKSRSFDPHYSVGLYSDGENYHSAGSVHGQAAMFHLIGFFPIKGAPKRIRGFS